MPSIYPPPGSIKSIQRGTASGNATVSAVNMSKARLTVTGVASAANSAENASLRLTSSTQLTYDKGSLSTNPVLAWELTEVY